MASLTSYPCSRGLNNREKKKTRMGRAFSNGTNHAFITQT